MRKLFLVLVVAVLAFTLSACGTNSDNGGKDGGNDNESNVVSTDESGEVVSSAEGTTKAVNALGITEDEVKQRLSVYSDDTLGLSADVYDYRFELSEISVEDSTGFLAKATLGDSKSYEAKFVIFNSYCLKYDGEAKAYMLLTENGIEKTDIKVNEEETATDKPESTSFIIKTDEQVADENNQVLQKRYAKYNLKKVGLPKDITEYEFKATGNAATASDGQQVYVIYLLEEGQYTEFKFAIGGGKDYYYDTKKEVFKPLS